jgi:hypothetical protein
LVFLFFSLEEDITDLRVIKSTWKVHAKKLTQIRREKKAQHAPRSRSLRPEAAKAAQTRGHLFLIGFYSTAHVAYIKFRRPGINVNDFWAPETL